MGEDDLEDEDFEEISRLIKQGFTSGYLDNEKGKHIYWELKVNIWRKNNAQG